MTNPNITQNDALKLAMASLVICLLLNLAVTGFQLTNKDNVWLNDNIQYDSNYVSILTTQVPTPIYCVSGDQTCTNQLTNVPAEDTNQFDKQ